MLFRLLHEIRPGGWAQTVLKLTLAAVMGSVYCQAQEVGVFTIPPASPTSQSTWVGYAWCKDQYGFFVPYCNPGLGAGYYLYTGGHIHEDPSHISDNYSGYITTSGTNTTSVGYQVTYHATRTGEREFIQVCANTCSTTDAIIRYSNLQQLYAGYNFILVGDKPWHPSNHWATQAGINGIVNTVQDYSSNYFTDPNYQIIAVNDEAIDYGGVFDICETPQANCAEGVLPWQPPHSRHDYGLAADFRANGSDNSIVSNAFGDFQAYCAREGLGSFVLLESVGTSNQHIHCDGN